MQWNGNVREFCDWCMATRDAAALAAGLRSVPDDMWSRVELQLHELRYVPTSFEPDEERLPFGERLRLLLSSRKVLDRARAAMDKTRVFKEECARRRASAR